MTHAHQFMYLNSNFCINSLNNKVHKNKKNLTKYIFDIVNLFVFLGLVN